MIAVDTNLLVYAHRSDTRFHEAAGRVLQQLADSRETWAIPWPCVHEFLSVVTGPVFGRAATPLLMALDAMHQFLTHPRCMTLCEREGHFDLLAALCQHGSIQGGAVHDARIAALCISHHVEEFWSADRDFSRFPDLRVRNPLIPSVHEPAAGYTPRRRRSPITA